MAQAAKAQEPSMEEILASIRRIIADDDKPAAVPETPKPAAPVARMVPPSAAPRGDVPKAPTTEPPSRPPAAAAPASDSAPAAGAPANDTQRSDVLDLTESMAADTAPSAPPSFRTIDGQSDVVFTEPAPAAAAEAAAPRPSDRLLSSAASAAVDSAFNSLTQTVLLQHGRTLDDLVQDMLRPMLKAWLDDNLPGLVERLVRAEIERVSRGR